MQKIVFSNNYFDRDTTVVVGFTLAYPIGSFVEKHATGGMDKKQVDSSIQPVVIDENLRK